MTRIALQYLESAWPGATPQTVRARLRQACGLLPIESLLLGWDLPPELEEAVAAETSQRGIALYRWHPLLASDSRAALPKTWQTIAVSGQSIPGFRGMPEFTFFCPNHPAAQDWIQKRIEKAIRRGIYQGIFFDRMRWPSPVEGLDGHFGCFCPHCQARAARNGLELEPARRQIEALLADEAGARRLIRALFAPEDADSPLEAFFRLRAECISQTVAQAAEQAHLGGLKVGLDCFSPSLTRMVGQDLSALDPSCDWIKLMIYPRTFGPAGIPYELHSLAAWLEKRYGIPFGDGLQFAQQSSGIASQESSTLAGELERGQRLSRSALFAGLALVEMEQVNSFSAAQLQSDLQACQQVRPAGLALSWDLWLIPLAHLETIAKTFFT